MPKLWNQTIEAHRSDVRAAILETTAALVTERGLQSVTMSEVASAVGIGRATLYKYFSDVGAILREWHEGRVRDHLSELSTLAAAGGDARARLEAVLTAFASIQREHHATELAALLHGGDHVVRAWHGLAKLVTDLLMESARAGVVRRDVPPEEIARFCLHALTAASSLRSEAALRRLVALTLAGLQPATAPQTEEKPKRTHPKQTR
ncbi:MAG: TetR/AcrR family transcriptional regulator [Polyangiaceae bacterium]|nr:TetR/AcrR family transcriptional regulator [Polyangiaceae bacterium]